MSKQIAMILSLSVGFMSHEVSGMLQNTTAFCGSFDRLFTGVAGQMVEILNKPRHDMHKLTNWSGNASSDRTTAKEAPFEMFERLNAWRHDMHKLTDFGDGFLGGDVGNCSKKAQLERQGMKVTVIFETLDAPALVSRFFKKVDEPVSASVAHEMYRRLWKHRDDITDFTLIM